MATMFFGQYLLAKGVIDRNALLEALDRQRRSNLSLPELAVQDGLIDQSRAEAIMAQYRMSDDSMEEILAGAGGLHTDQIRRLQSKQRSSWLRIGAALVEGGHLNDDEIGSNLQDFRSLESAADQEIREAMQHLPNADAVGACVELTMFHFGRVSGRLTKLGSITMAPDHLDAGRQRFSQRIVGDGEYTIAVDFPPPLISAVAKGMLGFDIEPGTETEADAVCEVINLIGGNACTRIEQFGQVLRPEPPIWSGIGRVVSPTAESVRAMASSAELDFDIRVFSVDREA